MKIISFSGRIGSGKDTAASYLIDNHGYKKTSFSSVLKDVTAVLFGWDRALLEGDTSESRAWREQEDTWWTDKLDMDIQVTPRWALQHMGTEVMRNNLHQDIWTLCMERYLERAGDKVVITDARFLNELNLVRSKGGTTVGIYRNAPKWLEPFYKEVDKQVNAAAQLFGRHCGFMDLDFSAVTERSLVVNTAQRVAKDQGILQHWSEMEHLLWNDYTVLLDNTQTLEALHQQVSKLA